MRVYELAKEYDTVSTEFLDVIQGFGIDIKSHLSSFSDDQVSLIREKMKNDIPSEEVVDFIPPPDVVNTEEMTSEKEIVAEKLGNLMQNEIDEVSQKEIPPPDVVNTEKLGNLMQNEIDEVFHKESVEREKKAYEIREHAEAHKREQFKSMSKPRGFFGWIASLFT